MRHYIFFPFFRGKWRGVICGVLEKVFSKNQLVITWYYNIWWLNPALSFLQFDDLDSALGPSEVFLCRFLRSFFMAICTVFETPSIKNFDRLIKTGLVS